MDAHWEFKQRRYQEAYQKAMDDHDKPGRTEDKLEGKEVPWKPLTCPLCRKVHEGHRTLSKEDGAFDSSRL